MKFLVTSLFYLFLATSASGQICLGLGQDGKCAGLSLDGLAKGERETDGLQLCAVSDGSSCNGVSIGILPSGKLNGLAISAIVYPDSASGVVVGVFVGGLFYVAPPENQIGSINGIAAGVTCSIGTINGVSVAMLNVSKIHRGIAIGGFNATSELHGLQIGGINYAANNPSWLRYLPFLNFHF